MEPRFFLVARMVRTLEEKRLLKLPIENVLDVLRQATKEFFSWEP